jgi:hypothetical protein
MHTIVFVKHELAKELGLMEKYEKDPTFKRHIIKNHILC